MSDFEEKGGDDQKEERPASSFSKWPELVQELQMIVVGNLDYATRTRLSFCSKQDYRVVSSTPVQINSIEMIDEEEAGNGTSQETTPCVTVNIEFGDGPQDNRVYSNLHFLHKENGTEISYASKTNLQSDDPERKCIVLDGKNYYNESVDFVEKLLKRCRYGVKSVNICMKSWPLEESGIQFLGKCEEFHIKSDDENVLKWWLERVPPNLKSLDVMKHYNSPVSPQLLSLENFKHCKHLRIWSPSLFTDEQFLEISAPKFLIESNTITDQAINQFVREWANGNRNSFLTLRLFFNRTVVKEEITKNLTVRKWDDEFVREAGDFSLQWERLMGRRDCYQVSKNDGTGTTATLDISNDWITFAVTGRRIQSNGGVHRNYNIPHTTGSEFYFAQV